ncbi:bile acid:sodium symporter family protein [Chryseobacterium sp. SL1]|uniref:bile acid:sodium symporter family protein n=1 Tax=Chryseobacterium sp. SL1 TaxID=2995159 RepID=UPI002272981C|nr:bile acid:sodium symporter [Chryseobacterium sp. SL1]MCY1660136.1 bile acid:sodium symporter [Chryseobacterium sp. SL1]
MLKLQIPFIMPDIDMLVSAVLFLIMLGIGISLSIKEVKAVYCNPKALLVSLCSQMILLPLLAFIIAFVFNIPAYIKIGLVILASSPGGTTSGFITYLFKGNVALSVTLTTLNSILVVFSIPLIVNFAIEHFEGNEKSFFLPFFYIVKEIGMLTVIPISIGILFKKLHKDLSLKLSKLLKPVMIVLLGIVFLLKFLGSEGKNGITGSEIMEILPFALLLNILCLLTGYSISKLFSLDKRDCITISIESAVHNTTMAFLISGTLLHNSNYGKVSLVYALFSFWTAIAFCFFVKKYDSNNVEAD